MPILDAIARHNRIRFVPARSGAGAMNMADALRGCRARSAWHHQHGNGGR
jgi:thiamine pyrophosphate-dependent acetolactate synthase large subunit-like protein